MKRLPFIIAPPVITRNFSPEQKAQYTKFRGEKDFRTLKCSKQLIEIMLISFNRHRFILLKLSIFDVVLLQIYGWKRWKKEMLTKALTGSEEMTNNKLSKKKVIL